MQILSYRYILLLRFPVSDVEAYAKQIQAKGVNLHQPITTINVAPYGTLKGFVVLSPDGVWLEFFELVDKESN